MAVLKHILVILFALSFLGFGSALQAHHLPASPKSTSVSVCLHHPGSPLVNGDTWTFQNRQLAIEKTCEEDGMPLRHVHAIVALSYMTAVPQPAPILAPSVLDKNVSLSLLCRYIKPAIPANAPPLA